MTATPHCARVAGSETSASDITVSDISPRAKSVSCGAAGRKAVLMSAEGEHELSLTGIAPAALTDLAQDLLDLLQEGAPVAPALRGIDKVAVT